MTGAPRILIVSATPPDSLVTALKMRNYQIDFVSPRSLSEHPEDYLPYQLVILDDVPAGIADARGAARAQSLRRRLRRRAGRDRRHVARGEPGRRRAGKGVAGKVRAAAAAAVARADRGLPVHRSIELDELRLALSRGARRRANPLRQGSRDRAAAPARRYRLRRRDRVRLAAVRARASAAARRGSRRARKPHRPPATRRRHRLQGRARNRRARDSAKRHPGAPGDSAHRRRHQPPVSRSRRSDRRICAPAHPRLDHPHRPRPRQPASCCRTSRRRPAASSIACRISRSCRCCWSG